jgi:hypothetical protein
MFQANVPGKSASFTKNIQLVNVIIVRLPEEEFL